VQYAENEDASAPLSPTQINRLQQITGTLLYYAIAVDPTMLVALGDIASEQTKATIKTLAKVEWLLDYAASNPLATIRYTASGMILYIHSDASYLSVSKARSRVGGHFFLSNPSTDPSKPPLVRPPLNGPIHTISKILKNVVGSAAEAEIAGTYVNATEAVPIVVTLEELGHIQPPTPIQVDNSTAFGFANKKIKIKRTKAIDMRYHWIVDRTSQGQFLIYLEPGDDNLGDYHTKHHSPTHHRHMRPIFLHENERLKTNVSMSTTHLASCVVLQLLRGCANSHIHRSTYDRATHMAKYYIQK